MELVSFDSYFLELVVGDFSRLLVLVSVEPSVHFKTLFGGRRTNEVNDDLQVFEPDGFVDALLDSAEEPTEEPG